LRCSTTQSVVMGTITACLPSSSRDGISRGWRVS